MEDYLNYKEYPILDDWKDLFVLLQDEIDKYSGNRVITMKGHFKYYCIPVFTERDFAIELSKRLPVSTKIIQLKDSIIKENISNRNEKNSLLIYFDKNNFDDLKNSKLIKPDDWDKLLREANND